MFLLHLHRQSLLEELPDLLTAQDILPTQTTYKVGLYSKSHTESSHPVERHTSLYLVRPNKSISFQNNIQYMQQVLDSRKHWRVYVICGDVICRFFEIAHPQWILYVENITVVQPILQTSHTTHRLQCAWYILSRVKQTMMSNRKASTYCTCFAFAQEFERGLRG